MMSQRIQIKDEVDVGFGINSGQKKGNKPSKNQLYDMNQFTDEDFDSNMQIGPNRNNQKN